MLTPLETTLAPARATNKRASYKQKSQPQTKEPPRNRGSPPELLAFRHYDELLSRELDRVYSLLDNGTGFWSRWRMARSATQLQTTLLDVEEIAERADNAIKFLGDMFAARFYKLAASRIGVPDYKDLVTQKVQTAEDLYRFMVDQFNHGRAFVLESAVLVILLIELVFLFRGKVF